MKEKVEKISRKGMTTSRTPGVEPLIPHKDLAKIRKSEDSRYF